MSCQLCYIMLYDVIVDYVLLSYIMVYVNSMILSTVHYAITVYVSTLCCIVSFYIRSHHVPKRPSGPDSVATRGSTEKQPYIYIYIYTHTHTCVHIHTYIYIYI